MKFANKRDRKMCAMCKKRPNTFSNGRRYKRDKEHDLCRQCHKSLSDSQWQAAHAPSKPEPSDSSSGSEPSVPPQSLLPTG